MSNANRYYEIENKKYPSVTTITSLLSKPQLYFWYGKHGTQKCKELSAAALKIGQELHDYINQCLITRVNTPPKNMCQENFIKFDQKYRPQVVMVEQVVHSATAKFAGTLDAVLQIEKKNILVDWKSSSALYEDYALQVHAYTFALTEMVISGILKLDATARIDELWIVRLAKEKEIDFDNDILKLQFDSVTMAAFLGLLKGFQWKYKEELNNERNHGTNNKPRRNHSQKMA